MSSAPPSRRRHEVVGGLILYFEAVHAIDRDSCPSHDDVGGFFFEFEAIRTSIEQTRSRGRRRDDGVTG